MQCNYNSSIQIINFHGLFRNALEVPKNWCLPNTGVLTVLCKCKVATCNVPLIWEHDWGQAPFGVKLSGDMWCVITKAI